MPEEKISPGLVIVGLGLGLVGVVGIAALSLAARAGFSLSIVNPPPDAIKWTALFLNEPMIYSRVFDLGEDEYAWKYPGNEDWVAPRASPFNREDLLIRTFDVNLTPTIQGQNLGPLEPGVDYVFDCATGELSEV